MTQRRARIADAGIALLARRGRPGLTHRAVDAEAGLPAGSTSYYARTRAALLELVVHRLAELDLDPGGRAEPPAPTDADSLADLLAGYVHGRLTGNRERTLARYELSLEAVHHPGVREVLVTTGAPFRTVAADLLAGLGSPDPQRHGRLLVACCDGLVLDAVAGAGSAHQPGLEELRRSLRDLLTGMLPG
ncbi:MAG TPA: TetR/AcrR family transcriptional regulator [Kineosporiaceae bacterium]|nr:TetR/AcrR family transcriptional regulator [Kineosporiaceae bacterium]